MYQNTGLCVSPHDPWVLSSFHPLGCPSPSPPLLLSSVLRCLGLTWHGLAWHAMAWFGWQVMGAGESVRIPSRLLLGIVPEVLLRSFHFWQYQVCTPLEV